MYDNIHNVLFIYQDVENFQNVKDLLVSKKGESVAQLLSFFIEHNFYLAVKSDIFPRAYI